MRVTQEDFRRAKAGLCKKKGAVPDGLPVNTVFRCVRCRRYCSPLVVVWLCHFQRVRSFFSPHVSGYVAGGA